MDLAVDHAGKDGEAAGVERLAGVRLGEVADGGEAAVPDADIGEAAAGVADHLAAAHDEIEARHWAGSSALAGWWWSAVRAISAWAAASTRAAGRSSMWRIAWSSRGSATLKSSNDRAPRTVAVRPVPVGSHGP